jgi:hypothetical protein
MAVGENICPVCGKVGIGNFRKELVVCPQCNSDLKAYMLLHRLENSNNTTEKVFLYIAIILLLLITTGVFFKYSETVAISNSQKTTLLLYKDSLNTIRVKQSLAMRSFPIAEKRATDSCVYFKYKVRKGDFTMKIARLFYSDWHKYKQIEQDNNLTEPYHLLIGEVLKIRVNQ